MPKPKQVEIPGSEAQAEQPKAVLNGKLLARYVRPHYSKDEKERHVALEFSFPLTKEHEKDGLLPAKVKRLWSILKGGGNKKMLDIEVAPHVEIYLAPDDKLTITSIRLFGSISRRCKSRCSTKWNRTKDEHNPIISG